MSEEELNKLAMEAAEALLVVLFGIDGVPVSGEVAEVLKPFLVRAFEAPRSRCDGT